MVQPTLLYSAAFSLLTGFVYSWIAIKVGRPGLPTEEHRALLMFKAWWHSLAGITYVTATFLLMAAFGAIDLAVFEALFYAQIVVIAIAVWGLTYYLAFLFTGKGRLFLPVAFYFGALALWLLYLVVLSDPNSVDVGNWQVQVGYANENALQDQSLLLVVLLIGPPLLGAIGYFLLFFRTDDPQARYRIAMVSVSLMVWFGSSVVASATGLTQVETWQVISRFISFGASLLILTAYQPPKWIRVKLQRAADKAQINQLS